MQTPEWPVDNYTIVLSEQSNQGECNQLALIVALIGQCVNLHMVLIRV